MQTDVSGSHSWEVSAMSEKRKYELRKGSNPPGRPKKGPHERKVNTTVGLTAHEKEIDKHIAKVMGITVNELYRLMRRQYYEVFNGEATLIRNDDDERNAS